MKHVCYFERVLDPALFEQQLTAGGDISLSRVDRDMSEQDLAEKLSAVHGYHTRGGTQLVPPRFRIDRDFLARCPRLVAVCTGGAGYDAINVGDCTEAGVLVANQAGLNAEAVAEHAFAMMLSLSKQLAQVNAALRRDPALDRFAYRGNDIFGKTLGIVGLGHIGTRIAEVGATAFGMTVLAAHPRLTPEAAKRRHAHLVALPELLSASDFVVVACGLSDETRGMFGASEFARMKSTAYFITVARGGIHDENALGDALSAGTIAGAGLDVWMEEPPPHDHPLLGFDNVLASPHIAAVTHESAHNASIGAAAQWREILNGKRPARLVNPAVWARYAARFEAIMGFPVEQNGDNPT